MVITLAALCGAFCGLWFPIDDLGPVYFQSVVGSVVAFEIALGCIWLRFRKKKKQTSPDSHELKAPASSRGSDIRASDQRPRLPRAPAILVICLIVVLSILAVTVLFQFTNQAFRPPGLGNISAFDDDDIAHTDAWLQKMVDSFYPSLSAAVVRDGEIVYLSAFGLKDISTSKQATPHTRYHVSGVTKVFTSSLAVILHDRGIVDLDQPVVTYLPDNVAISTTPEIGATITLRQLASHTSGLPKRVPGQVQSVEGWYQLEPQRLYDHLASVKLSSDPGTAVVYSNLGFGLLGHALERAAGRPFDQLVRDLICDPLRLERTSIQADDTLHAATGYSRRSHTETKHSFRKRLAASGGLVSTAEDLANFLAAQMEPGVFSSEMLHQLHTETKLSDGSSSRTSLGWSIQSHESVGRILTQNGGRNNCRAWIGFSPEHGVGVAVVTNCGGPYVDPIGEELLKQSVPVSRGNE